MSARRAEARGAAKGLVGSLLEGCLRPKRSAKAGMGAKQHAGAGLQQGCKKRALGGAMGERTGTALKKLEHALPK